MSTTRPYSPGDRGPEPGAGGASGAPEGDAPPDGAIAEGAPASAPASTAGRQTRCLSFDGESGVVPLARDFTRQAL
jgi:hypothetical protein